MGTYVTGGSQARGPPVRALFFGVRTPFFFGVHTITSIYLSVSISISLSKLSLFDTFWCSDHTS